MHGLQDLCPHCKKCLLGGSEKQNCVLQSIVLIHDVRTELVGSNQIKTVFGPEYEQIINNDGYDRISQYYLFHKISTQMKTA